MPESSLERSAAAWKTKQVYAMSGMCLVLGLAVGYLFRGSQTGSEVGATTTRSQAPGSPTAAAIQQMPTLEQMKHMADKQAEPLLLKLKDDPKNAALLVQIAKTYEATHQFKDAAGYYQQALAINPKDAATRTEMASCLYYNGDIDDALAQLEQTLKDDPASANALFNLGLIRWKGKQDAKGAVSAWRQLLKTNPKLAEAKKSQVEKLIADAQTHGSN